MPIPNNLTLMNAVLNSLRKEGHPSLSAAWIAQGRVLYGVEQGARHRIVRLEADGVRRVGRFVDRTFVPTP